MGGESAQLSGHFGLWPDTADAGSGGEAHSLQKLGFLQEEEASLWQASWKAGVVDAHRPGSCLSVCAGDVPSTQAHGHLSLSYFVPISCADTG